MLQNVLIFHITTKKGQQNAEIVATNNELNKVRICKSHVYFFKLDYKILCEIGNIASENTYFEGIFSDAWICVELTFF